MYSSVGRLRLPRPREIHVTQVSETIETIRATDTELLINLRFSDDIEVPAVVRHRTRDEGGFIDVKISAGMFDLAPEEVYQNAGGYLHEVLDRVLAAGFVLNDLYWEDRSNTDDDDRFSVTWKFRRAPYSDEARHLALQSDGLAFLRTFIARRFDVQIQRMKIGERVFPKLRFFDVSKGGEPKVSVTIHDPVAAAWGIMITRSKKGAAKLK